MKMQTMIAGIVFANFILLQKLITLWNSVLLKLATSQDLPCEVLKLYFYFKLLLSKGKLSAWCWMLIVNFYFDCMLTIILISVSLLFSFNNPLDYFSSFSFLMFRIGSEESWCEFWFAPSLVVMTLGSMTSLNFNFLIYKVGW